MRHYTQAEADISALRRRWAGLSPDDIDLTPTQRQIVTDLNVLLDALDDSERAGLDGELDDLLGWIMNDEDNTTTRRDIEREVAGALPDVEEKSGAAVLEALAPALAKLRDPDYTGIQYADANPLTRWIGLPVVRMACGTEIAYPVARLLLLLWQYRPLDWLGTSPYGGDLTAGENEDGEYTVRAGAFTLNADNAAELARKVRGV
jgi:hypothetical protein